MIIDTTKIVKLLNSPLTGYKVNKLVDITQQNYDKYKKGTLKVENMTLKVASELMKIININERKEVYLQSKVSAGTGVLDLNPTYGESISYDGEIPNHYDLAFLVSGNSMEPVFEDGEIIFVEKYPSAINGALMVVQIDGEAFIKKVYLEKDNLRLVSLNQDYNDILAKGTNNIRIVGKVVF